MSKIALSGDASGTGTFTIASPNSNSNFTLTLPAESGTALTTGTTTGISASALSTGTVPSARMPSGSILQITTATCDGVITTTANGAPNVITNGVQVFAAGITPLRSNSVLWVQTSSVAISEESNSADMCWLALWDGSTFIGANSGTLRFNLFASNLNGAYTSINDGYVAGSTSTRTIQVRAAMNGGSSTTYVNGNSSANYTGSSQRIRMIIWEIAA
jgi:hypothetical protein